MKLEKFKEKNNKRIGIIVFTIVCILLVSGVILYRTFAIFEVKINQNVIKGTVEDPGNIYFAFYQKSEEDGTYEITKNMPQKGSRYYFNSKESYCAVNGVKDESIIPWFDKDGWAVAVTGLKTSRTKCNLYFEKGENLKSKISSLATVVEGDGLYRVTHEDAEITYTDNVENQNMLKQEELRYAGSNPNNYVWFNHEVWRMIGLVNTPEGQRIKLIRNVSIGSYSWDSSAHEVNNGYGVNEWSQSDLMNLLNVYYYNSMENKRCFSNLDNITTECDFSKVGVKYSKELIDTITWNTGEVNNFSTLNYYNMERSKINNTYPDNIPRNDTWNGNIGLIYPSDYGYATIGGSEFSRKECLSYTIEKWADTYLDCKNYNWLKPSSDEYTTWLFSPINNITSVSAMAFTGFASYNYAYKAYTVKPALYLKPDVVVLSSTTGTESNPYIIN